MMDKTVLDFKSTMQWVNDAPEEVWKMIFPELQEKLRAEGENGEFLNQIREEILKKNMSISQLDEQLTDLKKSIDNFTGDQSGYKQQYLRLLYEVLEKAYETIISEGFAPRIIIPIEVEENAIVPTYANKGDAGADIFLKGDIIFPAGSTIQVPTGLKVALPDGWELQVRPKSGLTLKTSLRIANSPGTIDSGYRDEISIIVSNISMTNHKMKKGDKIAQLVLSPIWKAAFEQVEDVSKIGENRGGGFGSTGA